MKEIIIDIGNDAEISIETRGFQGKTCVEDEDVKFLKHLIGKRAYPTAYPGILRKQQAAHQKISQIMRLKEEAWTTKTSSRRHVSSSYDTYLDGQ